MKQTDEQEDDVSVMVTTGSTSAANLIRTEKEGKDVRTQSKLDDSSAFLFESFLHQVKRSIKGRTKFCSQLHRRFPEASFSGTVEQPTSESRVEFRRGKTLLFMRQYTLLNVLPDNVIIAERTGVN
ncbi:hypothetical protein FGIG_09341 [Fasciola gigantica]|uniref:Uncharacterized protein n=1 Tax=Fasciola gigantica TaxID=46835 RepID=A0A504XT83_FASGI|nr:hypothetical protein FGIG_09341 [Fasciola gigantica]